jgi:hypothetical protein
MEKLAPEGMIKHGWLGSDPRMPEQTRAYFLAPDAETLLNRHVAGPHLVDSERSRDFQKQVIEDRPKLSRDPNLFNK